MNLAGTAAASLELTEQVADGLASGQVQMHESASYPFAAGTGAGQCDLHWSRASTLAASASDTWTLSALADGLGRTVALARVRALLVENPAPVDGDDLTLGGAATNPWAAIPSGLVVKATGCELKVAMNATAFVVAAGSSDQLKITNSGAHPVTYRIAILGSSA